MKRHFMVFAVMVLTLTTFFISGVQAAVEVNPNSYPNGDTPVFTFKFPDGSNYNVTINRRECRRTNCLVDFVREEDRMEVEVLSPGDYKIRLRIAGEEYLSADKSRFTIINEEYPVRVGMISFHTHYTMSLTEGKAGYTFIVYPLFGYIPPSHIDGEMRFGDVVKAVSFNCGQRYIDTQGYCETNLIELSPQEYLQVVGDTYTCFETDETESCRVVRFNNFLKK